MNPLWIFGLLLAGICLLAFFGFFQPAEGFQTSPPGASTQTSAYVQQLLQQMRCPAGYTMFNSPAGDTLCCKGDINPYTHQCSNLADGVCAFSPNVRDPRDTSKFLPLCSTLVSTNAAAGVQCPSALPNYAEQSETAAKCCASSDIRFQGTGFTCSAADMKDKSKYCVVRGPLEPGEQMCDALVVKEDSQCPTDSLNRPLFQKVDYQMGDREVSHYQVPDLQGLTIPVCFRMNESCIPKKAIDYVKLRGAYIEYNPDTWEYSCEYWKRKEAGELIPNVQRGYLRPISGPTAA